MGESKKRKGARKFDSFQNAFNIGYRLGAHSALEGSVARKVMERDLIYVYGTMFLALHERGWTTAQMELLKADIQSKWTEYDNMYPETESMAEHIKKTLGLDLLQLTEAALESGSEEYLEGAHEQT